MTDLPPNQSPTQAPSNAVPSVQSTSIEWYHEGETRVVGVDGVQLTIRLVGRRGRRARIAIEAPAGAVFRSVETKEVNAVVALGRGD
jgi:hypothetical protein